MPFMAAGGRVFVYFQDKLGGEISLSRTGASPELSFDITVVELLPAASDDLWPGLSWARGHCRKVRRNRASDYRHPWQLQSRRNGA